MFYRYRLRELDGSDAVLTGVLDANCASSTSCRSRKRTRPSASFGSSRRAESCSLFCRLPYDHDLRVGVHRLPHPKMQGDLESCLPRIRRVIPAYFDHPPYDWPRLETRALKVRAQVLGELGFLDRDQQSAAAFWCEEEQRGGCRAPPHRARQADYRRRCRVHSSPVQWFI